QVNGVEKRRAPLGLGEGKAVLDLFETGGKAHHQLRTVVELDQEELVLGIGGLEELRGGLARLVEFGSHAAADVEHQADRQRSVFTGEVGHFLLALVLKEAKILAIEARDEAVERI